MSIALGTVVLVTMLMYHFGPARRPRWREVFPGAVVATVMWLGATLAFAWYLLSQAADVETRLHDEIVSRAMAGEGPPGQ